MSEIAISSTNWLAISLRNSTAIVFNLNDTQQCQCLTAVPNNEPPKAIIPAEKRQTENGDDDENSIDLNRNLIKFSPDGRKLAINGQNKQIYIYIPSNDPTTSSYWQLQRMITVKKRASAFDLTNDFLLIADKSGDVYRADLSNDTNLVLTADDCIMGHLSMLLDIAFVRTNTNEEYLLTADRDEKIRLSHYPNAYNIQGYCLGHTEFVSHMKLVDSNHLLSASGDGTLRLWHLPDCLQLNAFQTTTLTSSAKHVFYGTSSTAQQSESPVDSSSPNDSIWKMDATSTGAATLVAISVYGHRTNSIYLTTLAELQKSSIESRKLTFDSTYGTIIDYCFSLGNSPCDLYILFDSNTLLKVNAMSIVASDKKDHVEQKNDFSALLASKELYSVNEMIFKQLFKTRGDPGDSSYYKRKHQRIEQQEEKRRKKQVSTQFQEKVAIDENV